MSNDVFCVIDFETTGLDAKDDFPIEVACILCDQDWRELARYGSLVSCFEIRHELSRRKCAHCGHDVRGAEATPSTPVSDWPERWADAHKVHGISVAEVLEADDAIVVWADIVRMVRVAGGSRTTLVSDNAVFDTAFAQRLCRIADESHQYAAKWPFHYSTWDASLLLAAAGVPKPKKPHRAMPDAELLLGAIREAWARTAGARDGGA